MRNKLFLLLSVFLLISFVAAQAEICVDFDLPSAPSSLAVTSSGQDIILTWEAATDTPSCSGVDYYVIVRNGNLILGNTPSLTFTDINVPYGTYSYSVYAVDKAAHQGGQAIKNDIVLSAPIISSDNSGGGGGGGTVVSGGNPVNSYICNERWDCGEWSNCTNGEQTRNCVDLAGCGTILNKPAISQTCTTNISNRASLFGITGGVVGIFGNLVGSIIGKILVILIGITILVILFFVIKDKVKIKK